MSDDPAPASVWGTNTRETESANGPAEMSRSEKREENQGEGERKEEREKHTQLTASGKQKQKKNKLVGHFTQLCCVPHPFTACSDAAAHLAQTAQAHADMMFGSPVVSSTSPPFNVFDKQQTTGVWCLQVLRNAQSEHVYTQLLYIIAPLSFKIHETRQIWNPELSCTCGYFLYHSMWWI